MNVIAENQFVDNFEYQYQINDHGDVLILMVEK